jgi:hypothetical protein
MMMNKKRLPLVLFSAFVVAPLAHAAEAVKLSKEETQKTLSGKSITYKGREGALQTYFAPDGNVTHRSFTSSRTSTGTWTVEDDGRFCIKIIKGTGNDSCRFLMRTDTGFGMSDSGRSAGLAIDKIE